MHDQCVNRNSFTAQGFFLRLLPGICLGIAVLAAFALHNACAKDKEVPYYISYFKGAPSIEDDKIPPLKLVDIANELIKEGKNQGINSLRLYERTLDATDDKSSVFLICSMIFKPNAKIGWRRWQLGASQLSVEGELSFDTFPVLFANKVPFVITKGYSLAGTPENSSAYIDFCEKNYDYNRELYKNRNIKGASEEAAKMIRGNKVLTQEEKDTILKLIAEQVSASAEQ